MSHSAQYQLPKGHPKTPVYVLEEALLRKNLELVRHVADETAAEFILAFKAFALWKSFPIFREYISGCTASSLYEAKMGYEKMQTKPYTYAPVYHPQEIEELLSLSAHISFNSLSQYNKYIDLIAERYPEVSVGLRINPGYSPVSTALYNPCGTGSRLGVKASEMPDKLPYGVEGLHSHNLCESTAEDLELSLQIIERDFARFLPKLKWLNLGGGHLLTHQSYDIQKMIQLLKDFQARYPQLKLILEPGSAFVWQTGYLAVSVLDVVENNGIKTLMIDASFAGHMPDTLEMPYQPAIRGAQIGGTDGDPGVYRVGGASCLSGDFIGNWSFGRDIQVGDVLFLEDMIHYTTVKTTMFNGLHHPAIAIKHLDGSYEIYREYSYADYLSRMC